MYVDTLLLVLVLLHSASLSTWICPELLAGRIATVSAIQCHDSPDKLRYVVYREQIRAANI